MWALASPQSSMNTKLIIPSTKVGLLQPPQRDRQEPYLRPRLQLLIKTYWYLQHVSMEQRSLRLPYYTNILEQKHTRYLVPGKYMSSFFSYFRFAATTSSTYGVNMGERRLHLLLLPQQCNTEQLLLYIYGSNASPCFSSYFLASATTISTS